ncbi:MAG: DUF4062 domain-containing protein [Actinomycetota bacterium]
MRTATATGHIIRTPDQRLRVFISSTMGELADEREAASAAVRTLHLTPVLFEGGARPHPPRALYRAYLEQSHVFLGIYWKSYGWSAPDMDVSGIEDEYNLASDKPKLIYIKDRSASRDPQLKDLIGKMSGDAGSYKYFSDADELKTLIENDLALFLTERFQQAASHRVDEPTQERTSNIPALVNLFVGREKERAALSSMLLEDGVRLVTLTGPGGIGKSRLALEFAASVEDRFPDGAHLVLLQTITDPQLVGPTIASTLRITEVPGVSIEKVLVAELQDKKALLVLDNFEQILAAANIVGEIVEGCPGVVVIVTSRSPLNIRGEQDLPIPPLAVPPARADETIERLSQYEAVSLFIERARAARSDLEVTDADAHAVAEICHRLEGIPLAIELAAARIKLLTPEAMLARLQDRFALLRGGWRDLPERQKTLKGTIDWSFDLLDPDERQLFTKVAVFTGGWTIEAAQRVCDPDGGLDVLDVMASLADKSLISPVLTADEPRFTMLETIREYALERLGDTEGSSILCDRHAELFMQLAVDSRPRLRSAEQERTLQRLEDEYDNIRAAINWLLENERYGDVATGTWMLSYFWWLHDHLKEGLRVAAAILDAPGLTDLESARVKFAKGFMDFWFGEYAPALPLLTESLDRFRELDEREGLALAQLPLGFIGSVLVGPEDAFSRFEEAQAIFEELGDLWGEVLVRNARGWVEIGLGLNIPATALEETLSRAQALGTEIEYGMAAGNLGTHRVREGRMDEARELLHSTLEILTKNGLRNLVSYTLDQVAELAIAEGHPEAAARFFGAAERIRNMVGALLAPMHDAYRRGLIDRASEMAGREAFERAHAEGLQLRFRRAVAEAIALLDNPGDA